MSYTANQIADWFISKVNTEAGDTISPLKLQKLIYYAQAWHLASFGESLFEGRIEARRHGPVAPSVYQRFRDLCMDCQIMPSEIKLDIPELKPEQEQLLSEVLETYGEHSASYLENLTHSETPWIEARAGCPPYEKCNNEIRHEVMMVFYRSMNGKEASGA